MVVAKDWKSWGKWDYMSEEAHNPRIATGEAHEKEAKDRTPPGGEQMAQYG